MSWALFWTALAIILAIVEAATFGLTTIWFVAGALVALLASWLGFSIYIQVILFFVTSVALLILTRPLVMKYVQAGSVKTNIDSLIGKHAIVTKEISEHVFGQVKLEGQIWTAKGSDDLAFPVGIEVTVEKIEGVKLVVKRG